jgi:hypothetical protein
MTTRNQKDVAAEDGCWADDVNDLYHASHTDAGSRVVPGSEGKLWLWKVYTAASRTSNAVRGLLAWSYQLRPSRRFDAVLLSVPYRCRVVYRGR